jgi:LysM repeat protein
VYGYKDVTYKIITVKRGDTLWDIASKYGNKNTDIRQTIFEIQKLNNLSSSMLYEGEEIKVVMK